MSVAVASTPLLSTRRLTWDEICACYPSQWVVLVDLEFVAGPYSAIRSARVAGHGGDDESLEMADPHLDHYQEFARLHTRPPDPPRSWDGDAVPCLAPP